MRTQDIEYRADGVRMVGQYVVDDSSSRAPARRADHPRGSGPHRAHQEDRRAAGGAGLRRLRHGLSRRGQAASQPGRGPAADRCLDRQPDRHHGARHRGARCAEGPEGGRHRPAGRRSATASAAPPRSSSAARAATSRRSWASTPASRPRVRRPRRTSRARCWSISAPRIRSSHPSSAPPSRAR